MPGNVRNTIFHISCGEILLDLPGDAPIRVGRYWLKGMAAHLQEFCFFTLLPVQTAISRGMSSRKLHGRIIAGLMTASPSC